jgi:hypothetical protein
MQKGDRLKIEIPESKLSEEIKGVAFIRQVIKSSTINELEGKELTFVGFSPVNNEWFIVRTKEGDEYEIHKQYLKKIL